MIDKPTISLYLIIPLGLYTLQKYQVGHWPRWQETKADAISCTNFHSSLLTHEFLNKAALQPTITALLLPIPTQQPAAFFVQNHSGFNTARRGHFHRGWRNNNNHNSVYRGNNGNNSYTSGQQFGQQGHRFSS